MPDKPKLGVALTRCYFCLESDRIVLNSLLTERLASQVEGMNGKVIDMEPCAKCADLMKQGVILITIDDGKSGKDWNKQPIPNPYRTGGFFVVKEEAARRMFTGPALDFALKRRFCFIEHAAAETLGFFEMVK